MICTRSLTQLRRKRYVSTILRSVATFSSERKALQRNRAAGMENAEQFDYLRDGVAENLTGEFSDFRHFPFAS